MDRVRCAHTGGMQFVELKTWIPRFNINYHLGVDGISMLFVILNSFITIIVCWPAGKSSSRRSRSTTPPS
jgi:NADH:ubiquinone oxidoreductase subunit 4 (subunit M)